MKGLKDTLFSALGSVGFVIYCLISTILLFMPLVFLDLNIFIDAILIFVIIYIPFIGGICEFILWLLSFFVVLNEPFNVFIALYYVALAIYVLTTLLPFIISFFSKQ